jgi:hypothetical protein
MTIDIAAHEAFETTWEGTHIFRDGVSIVIEGDNQAYFSGVLEGFEGKAICA